MDYVPPVGGSGLDPYVDQNLPTTLGSKVPAAAIEHPMREVYNLIVLAGQTPNSGDLTQLLAGVLALIRNQVNNYTRQQYFVTATLTDAANIAWNLNTQQVAEVTLGGNRTLDNPTNMQAGGFYSVDVIQDGTGGRTLAYGTAYKWPNDVAPVVDPTAGARTTLNFKCVNNGGTKYMLGMDSGPYSV